MQYDGKGGGIYGDKKDKKGKKKENQNGSQTMDNAPTSTFFNMLMNIAGGMIEKMAAKPAADKASEEHSQALISEDTIMRLLAMR